jgi:hypothetical protein
MSEPTPAAAAASSGLAADRRAYVRIASDLSATCAAADQRQPGWPARVRDISCGGVGLVLQHRFRPGTTLTVELRDQSGRVLRTAQARVAHATAVRDEAGQRWLLGCAFDRPLTEEEFAALA